MRRLGAAQKGNACRGHKADAVDTLISRLQQRGEGRVLGAVEEVLAVGAAGGEGKRGTVCMPNNVPTMTTTTSAAN